MIKLKKYDDAVSPVIGVFLTVTMTVILLGIVTSSIFIFGLPNPAPQVSIRAVTASPAFDYVKLEHMGGSDIKLKEVELIIQNSNSKVSWTNLDSTTAIMRAHDTLFIYTNSISGTEVYLNGDANTGAVASAKGYTGSVDIIGGDTISITMIDIPSGQVIAELKVKA